MKRYVWPNFVFSVWLLIGYCVLLFVANVLNLPGLDERFGPFSARVALGPLAIGTIEALLWYRPFRYRESGWRIMAVFMTIVLLLYAVVVPLIVADLYDGYQVSRLGIAVLTYVAASHLLAAVMNSNEA